MPRKERLAKMKRVGDTIVDTETGEVHEIEGGLFDNIDKTKPMSDEQYEAVKKLPDNEKRRVMSGFRNEGWSEDDVKRHYLAAHFPEIRYHSSGGGGKGSVTPPTSKR